MAGKQRPRNPAHKGDKGKNNVLIDYDTFLMCFKAWCAGTMKSQECGERCGVSYQTFNNRLKYIFEHNGAMPSMWFSYGGRELTEVMKEMEEEKKKNAEQSD